MIMARDADYRTTKYDLMVKKQRTYDDSSMSAGGHQHSQLSFGWDSYIFYLTLKLIRQISDFSIAD